jgi:hypothetical protein
MVSVSENTTESKKKSDNLFVLYFVEIDAGQGQKQPKL